MHVFPYSRRPGTPADKMDGQCPRAVKERRAKQARDIAHEMKLAFLEQSIGKTLPVLFETPADGGFTGHSDTYLLVRAQGEELRGKTLNVKIISREGEVLCGEIENAEA